MELSQVIDLCMGQIRLANQTLVLQC